VAGHVNIPLPRSFLLQRLSLSSILASLCGSVACLSVPSKRKAKQRRQRLPTAKVLYVSVWFMWFVCGLCVCGASVLASVASREALCISSVRLIRIRQDFKKQASNAAMHMCFSNSRHTHTTHKAYIPPLTLLTRYRAFPVPRIIDTGGLLVNLSPCLVALSSFFLFPIIIAPFARPCASSHPTHPTHTRPQSAWCETALPYIQAARPGRASAVKYIVS
jgi:hypothetical protein